MTLVVAPGGGDCRFCGEARPHSVLLAADYLDFLFVRVETIAPHNELALAEAPDTPTGWAVMPVEHP
ncbi:hypothetical protein [Streptomyces sp. NPDC005731]|uniref:hypothetical protein n=1 Tax=Streptomyces sp. NPDC005731 TaxID=3157056 RepID=UPI0033E7C367